MMTEQQSQQLQPFNIKEYQDYLEGDDYRNYQIARLKELHRESKIISLEKINILTSFSDSEKNKRLVEVVTDIWGGVLSTDTQNSTIEDIVSMSVGAQEDIDLLKESKNKPNFPSGDVFDLHFEHPTQKKLTKTKYLSKRAVKKQKTPMQTISYVYNAKSNSDRDDRLLEIEKHLAEMDYKLSLLAVNQMSIGSQVDTHSTEISLVKQRLSLVEDKIKDDRKLKLYALYTSEKKTTNSELSKEIGVNVRTIRRWLVELRELGVIE